MKLEQGTLCWIPNNEVGWLSVVVKKVDYDSNTKKYRIELETDDNSSHKYDADRLVVETGNINENNEQLPKLRNLDDPVDDLTTLSHLNEPSVLNSVKLRYADRIIYTFSGVVLIAVNPFEKMDTLYTQSVIHKYQNADKAKNPPHVFSIADEAYKSMKKTTNSQSIIVSGESGAGKTVSAKYIMRFFASVHTEGTSIDTTKIERQILATNPIMEAFGNAKTTRNDNSSRFGKYLKISFDENNVICGAQIQVYLLERSRLVHQSDNERNYHIFYQLIEGLSEKLKAELFLTKCEDFKYLNQGGTYSVKGLDETNEFKDTCEALRVIGIDDHKQFELFKILAGLLHVGNINIENLRNEAVLSLDDSHLKYASNLLGIDTNEFAKCITKKTISTRADSITSTLKYHEAIVARDSFSKSIYSALFDWLVSYINNDLSPPDIRAKTSSFIGVLDIYGFEHFQINSFEQFCINYANEKLQQEFTHHVFKLQQEDYIKEGIEWSFITYSDNQPCIDVIENRGGILSLLDEQCKLPAGSDKAWAEKMFHSLAKPPHNKIFKKGRFGHEKFIVAHYALDVSYEVDGFLEKNRDTVSSAQNEVLKATKNAFLKEIIPSDDTLSTAVHEKRRSLRNRNRKPTLGHMFQKSLNELMCTIRSTDAHYIRCIKPNETKKAWEFNNLMVLSQLRACGVLETIRISLVGFPSKYTYDEFLNRFMILLPSEDEIKFARGEYSSQEDMKKLSIKLLRQTISDQTLYQPGKTKLFFRAGVLGQLEVSKSNKIHLAAIALQKNIRCYLMRQHWLDVLSSMIYLQSHIRGSIVRHSTQKGILGCIMIQSLARGFICRNKIHKVTVSVVVLQSHVRGLLARNRYEELKYRIKQKEEKRREEEEEEDKLKKHAEEMERVAKEKLLQEAELIKKLEQEKLEQEQKAKERALEILVSSKEDDANESRNFENNSSNQQSGTSRPTSLSEFYKSEDDNAEKVEEIWNILSSNAHYPQYKEDELVSLKPNDALITIAKYIVLRMRSISDSLEMYQRQHPDFKQALLTEKIQQNFRTDISVLRNTMKRVKYVKPETGIKNLSVRSVSSISVDRITSGSSFGMSSLDRSLKSGYSDIVEYMKGPSFVIKLVANLLLENIQPPSESPESPSEIGTILYPARLIVALLFEMWEMGMINQSVIFFDCAINIFKNNLLELRDSEIIICIGSYLLNNVNEIRSRVALARYNSMHDLNTQSNNAGLDRSQYLKMLLIMKRYCETIFGKMYHFWMNTILDNIQKKGVDAVALDDSYFTIKESPRAFFRNSIQKGPKYKMFDLVRLFQNVYSAMKSYCFDDVIASSVIHDVLICLDITCFNGIITRDGYLSFDKGDLLKSNITLLLDWCKDNDIPDAPNTLMHLLTLCQILQLQKLGLSDIDQIAASCDTITRPQIARILKECGKNGDEEKKVDALTVVVTNDSTISKSAYTIPLDDDIFENAFLSSS